VKGERVRDLFDPITLMIVTVAGIGVLSIISIATNNVWGFVIGIALGLGLLFGGIFRLRAGDTETAKITCLVVAVVGVVLGFITMFLGRSAVVLGIVDIVVSIPAGYAWYSLQTGG
jgi:hypothetical protein